MILDLNNVSVRYGRFTALQEVNLQLEGGVVGLLGPNGAGKSTLIKTLLGFNRPAVGNLSVMGYKMPRQMLYVRQRVGYMPEREVVSPKISAVSFLTFVGTLFGMSRVDAMERAHEVLSYVGLGESRYRKMQTYSTGMLQRVKLAQSIIHDPQLLLLDEPTNGLDPEGRVEMLDLVAEIGRDRKVTILLSSHLLPDVQHVCERVVVLKKGRVVRDASMAELTRPVDKTYEVRVRDRSNEFLDVLAREGWQSRTEHDGTLLLRHETNGTQQSLFAAAQQCNTQIRHLRPARQTLAGALLEALDKE